MLRHRAGQLEQVWRQRTACATLATKVTLAQECEILKLMSPHHRVLAILPCLRCSELIFITSSVLLHFS